jgi:hypothetical protein
VQCSWWHRRCILGIFWIDIYNLSTSFVPLTSSAWLYHVTHDCDAGEIFDWGHQRCQIPQSWDWIRDNIWTHSCHQGTFLPLWIVYGGSIIFLISNSEVIIDSIWFPIRKTPTMPYNLHFPPRSHSWKISLQWKWTLSTRSWWERCRHSISMIAQRWFRRPIILGADQHKFQTVA